MEFVENFNLFIESLQRIVADETGKFLVMYIAILICMIVDLVFGVAKSFINRNIVSKKISDGLIKKGSILILLALLFFIGVLLPDPFGVMMIWSIFLLALYNELISIIENIAKMGVDVKFLQPIIERLSVEVEKKGDDENE